MIDQQTLEAELIQEFKTVQAQVRAFLHKYPATRDNDFYLQVLYMKLVLKIPIGWIDWQNMKDWAGRLETIRRTRQKIQEKGDFPSTDPVRLARQAKAKAYRKILRSM